MASMAARARLTSSWTTSVSSAVTALATSSLPGGLHPARPPDALARGPTIPAPLARPTRCARSLLRHRRGAVVLDVEADAHRLLARVLLGDFRGNAGDAADDENEPAGGRGEAHVVQDARQGAVDIHRDRSDLTAHLGLDRF